MAALGKIIKYQSTVIDVNSLIAHWLTLLPIKHDIDEAKQQNEFLSQLLVSSPLVVLGDQYQRFDLVIGLMGEVINKKFVNEETGVRLANFVKQVAGDATMGPRFRTVFENLSNESKERIQQALNFTA